MNNRQNLANRYLGTQRFSASGISRLNAGGSTRFGKQNIGVGRMPATGNYFGEQATYSAAGQSQGGMISPTLGIRIANASASNVSNLDIFGAFGNTQSPKIAGSTATFNSNGDLVSGGVTISTIFGTTNYQEFLYSTTAQQFKAGGFYLQLISGSDTSLVTQVITHTQRSQSGAVIQTPFKPILNPMSFQSSITMNYTSFVIDGYCKLAWTTFTAGCTLDILFFPDQTINPTNALSGGGVVGNYGSAPLQ